MTDLIDTIRGLFTGLLQDSPWWFYALIALIPISMILATREGFCWFWKQNSMLSKLDKIDKKLGILIQHLEQKPKKESPKKVVEEKFSLQEEEYKLK